jgi:L-malate glycosyltransferase
MKIFIITETLLAGGAEWFSLRLSDALIRRGHDVMLFVLRPDLVDKRIISKYPQVPVYHLPAQTIRVAALADRALRFILKTPYLLRILNSRFIKKYIDLSTPDVIHSHLLTADRRGIDANDKKVRHVTTIHGDYISILKQKMKDGTKEVEDILARLDTIVTISDEQIKILTSEIPALTTKIKKIYNGYVLPANIPIEEPKETFNFGLIARGIPEKGWEPAIQAFLMLNAPNARLHLYGEGTFLDQLKKKYTDSRIIFGGFTSSPLEIVAKLDVGLLPSYYTSESLPTTIIEYLALGKPVIATAAGEIPLMLDVEGASPAGILIPVCDPAKMVEPLFAAMSKLMLDDILYDQLSANCHKAFEKFSMNNCVDSYLDVYVKEKKHACVES